MREQNSNNFWELFRIIVPALVAVSLFIFSSFYLFLPEFEKSLLEDRKMMIRELVQSSWHMIEHLDKEVSSGMYSLKDAQYLASHHLREMRYGVDSKDYFWVNDFTPTLIMHPYRPDLEGKDLSNFADPTGTKLFVEFVKKVTEKKQGYVPYMWQWKDDPTRIVPKLSFVKGYKPWGWIIGTGIYLEDIEEEIASMTRRLIVASVIILILVSLLAWYQIYQALKALKLRQQAEAELALKNIILSTQQETSLDGILVIDENGKMVSSNQRFLDMWGISEEVTGSMNDVFSLQSVLEKLPDPEQFTERVKYLYDHQNEKSREEIILKDARVFDRYSSPMSGPDGQYLGRVWYFRDISDKKQAEKEKTIIEAQLRQTQKMEAIGTLAGGIAHDFNNILCAIMGYLELVKMDLPPESPINDDLEEVFKASLRATDLVRQILTFSRKTKTDKKAVKLNLLVKETIKLLRASIPSTIEIRRDIPVQCPNVVADPTQIHQIVMNLCTNAYHAMRESGGVLSISLEEVTIGPDENLMEDSFKPGPYLLLEISDTGKGISPEILTKIFEPYFTTKEVNEGTGLGLSVVHGIVKSHHGHITVYSEVGKGTTFKVYLPAENGHEDSKSQETVEKVLGGSERIIFVDDEETLARLGYKLLSNLGYEVTAFSNSLQALKAFSEAPDKYDLIITDMTMPGMTGAEMAKEIKQIRPDIPIILCTGFTEGLDKKWATEMGFRAYLTKPVQQKELTDAIRKALELGS